MKNPPIEVQGRTVHDHFSRFATLASGWMGSTWTFLPAGLVVVLWAATGPVFHFSNKWAMVIGTGTSIATFLMVILIQSTQNRDTRAINLKLNELIRAMDKARNQMIDIERLSDLELNEMQSTYEKIKTSWSSRQACPRHAPAEKYCRGSLLPGPTAAPGRSVFNPQSKNISNSKTTLQGKTSNLHLLWPIRYCGDAGLREQLSVRGEEDEQAKSEGRDRRGCGKRQTPTGQADRQHRDSSQRRRPTVEGQG